MENNYDYDFFVIGGGSGGISAARHAVAHKAKVAIADYVTESPQGTQWGLGGTCVNVGCIPKKLMHYSSLLGEAKEDMIASGWQIDPHAKHDWKKMVDGIKKHVFGLYWGGKKMLRTKDIKYYHKLARFVDAHTLELYEPNSEKTERVTAKYILIANGGRPTYDDVPGVKEHAISSDDLFYLSNNPGKTLIVGAGYIAVECAGFLQGFGNDVSLLIRSSLLRNFDSDVTKKLGKYMESKGTKMLYGKMVKLEKLENGRKKVTYRDNDGKEHTEEYDTVLYAIGRTANTASLNLQAVGVEINPENKKVKVNDSDQTNIPHIYALGDVADGRLELTPVAVMAGRLLAERLFGGSQELMDYKFVPTTIFSPLEYGSIGYNEKEAQEKFGKENVIGYHGVFKPLEWAFSPTHPGDACYIKMVCKKDENQTVIGLHFLGPNAGEVIQGFSVAVKYGIGKKYFDKVVGIHPTTAEEVLNLNLTTDQPTRVAEGCVGCGF